MEENDCLNGKKILVVDDEPDILETLEELLSMCDITKASSFDEAWNLLGANFYDLVVLDIMGVDGYKLLSLVNERKITAVMLTAHAFSPEDTKRSYMEGAAYYIPKEEIGNIESHLNDVLEAKKSGKNPWGKWLDSFLSIFNRKFSTDWQKIDENFWDEMKYLN